MLAKYDTVLAMRNYKPASRKRLIRLVRRFYTSVNTPISEITPSVLESYFLTLKAAGRSAKTIENHRSAIKGFFDFLALHGFVTVNPVAKLHSIDPPKTLPVFLPDPEITLLLELAHHERIDVEVKVALNTGLRLDELRHLKWGDLDLDRRQLIVQGQHAKGKRPRTVPLNTTALEAFSTQRTLYRRFSHVFPGGQGGKHGRNLWTKNTMRSYKWWLRLSLDPIREKIPTIANLPKGVTGRGWHIMRHTFATKLARAGVDPFKIKDWMGHSQIETTLRYVHLARHYDKDIELIT